MDKIKIQTYFLDTIEVIQEKCNLQYCMGEIQTRKYDDVTFAHTLFRSKEDFKFIPLLIVITDKQIKILTNDKPDLNEMVDKVVKINGRICATSNDIKEVILK